MDEKKQNKTGIMILLAMVAAMGFLAATEGGCASANAERCCRASCRLQR